MNYVKATVEIVELSNEDVVTASRPEGVTDEEIRNCRYVLGWFLWCRLLQLGQGYYGYSLMDDDYDDFGDFD